MRSTLPLYAGGFLGPFGGGILVALIPNVAAGLDASVGLVAAAITAYMIPFAALQLVSGTIATRLGPGRVVRAGYVVFGAAALLAALAPEIWSFMAARVVMGAANAFLTPVLLAALSELVAPDVLGRSVGTFAAWQAAGVALAPALGGAIGEASWRLAFGLVAFVAAVLALAGTPLVARQRLGIRGSLRTLVNRWMGLLGGAALLGYLGFTSIGFVVALVAAEEFGLGPGSRGVVVSSYGIGAIVIGRPAGAVADRAGRPATALVGTLACAGGVAGLALAPTAWALGLCFLAVGLASAFAWAGLNTIAVESSRENRAGVMSAYGAFKFLGLAVAPFVYVPLFEESVRSPFWLAAGFSLLLAVAILPWFGRYRADTA